MKETVCVWLRCLERVHACMCVQGLVDLSACVGVGACVSVCDPIAWMESMCASLCNCLWVGVGVLLCVLVRVCVQNHVCEYKNVGWRCSCVGKSVNKIVCGKCMRNFPETSSDTQSFLSKIWYNRVQTLISSSLSLSFDLFLLLSLYNSRSLSCHHIGLAYYYFISLSPNLSHSHPHLDPHANTRTCSRTSNTTHAKLNS